MKGRFFIGIFVAYPPSRTYLLVVVFLVSIDPVQIHKKFVTKAMKSIKVPTLSIISRIIRHKSLGFGATVPGKRRRRSYGLVEKLRPDPACCATPKAESHDHPPQKIALTPLLLTLLLQTVFPREEEAQKELGQWKNWII
jgi:hypothetical protein